MPWPREPSWVQGQGSHTGRLLLLYFCITERDVGLVGEAGRGPGLSLLAPQWRKHWMPQQRLCWQEWRTYRPPRPWWNHYVRSTLHPSDDSLLVANSIWVTLRNMATNSRPLHLVAFIDVLCPALYITHFFSQKLKSLTPYTKPTEFLLLHPRSLPPTCSLREPAPFLGPCLLPVEDALFCIMAFLPGLLHSSFLVCSFVL